jgi:hypothetical protein
VNQTTTTKESTVSADDDDREVFRAIVEYQKLMSGETLSNSDLACAAVIALDINLWRRAKESIARLKKLGALRDLKRGGGRGN